MSKILLGVHKEVIGNCTLYLGDNLRVMPELPQVDAVITDPNYGIGRDGQTSRQVWGKHGGRKEYEFLGWDSDRPPKEAFDLMIQAAPLQIIWGGNYFADLLPRAYKWLVWDKGQRIITSDCELAWTSMKGALRIFTLSRIELATDGAVYPTQKPLRLMHWCIMQAGVPETVLDPFMGSGSTGVACLRSGVKFIGIDKEPKAFEIACRRIQEEVDKPNLFAAELVQYKPTQFNLMDKKEKP